MNLRIQIVRIATALCCTTPGWAQHFSPAIIPIKEPQKPVSVSTMDCIFTNAKGVKWLAPKGTITDGASIPDVAIPFIGSRLDKRYRGASLIHDAYCGKANKKGASYHNAMWEDVARMFYEGCLAGGTSQTTALIMYAAVWMYPPNRWAYADPKSKSFKDALAGIKSQQAGELTAADSTQARVAVVASQSQEIQLLDASNTSDALQEEQFKEVVGFIQRNPSDLTLPELDSVMQKASSQLKTTNRVLVLPGKASTKFER